MYIMDTEHFSRVDTKTVSVLMTNSVNCKPQTGWDQNSQLNKQIWTLKESVKWILWAFRFLMLKERSKKCYWMKMGKFSLQASSYHLSFKASRAGDHSVMSMSYEPVLETFYPSFLNILFNRPNQNDEYQPQSLSLKQELILRCLVYEVIEICAWVCECKTINW